MMVLYDAGRSYVESIPPLPLKERFLLPHWCIYVAYALCFILMAFSIILVILYGHKFGKDIALRWLLALTFSLFESIFVLEPLKVGDSQHFVLELLSPYITELDLGFYHI